MSNWWYLVFAVVVGWFVIWQLLELALTRTLWNKTWSGPRWVPGAVRTTMLLWTAILPILAVTAFLMNEGIKNRKHIMFFYGMLAAYVLISSLLTFAWRKHRVRLAGGKISSVSLRERWGNLRSLRPFFIFMFYPFILMIPGASSYSGFYMIVAMCYFMWDAARKKKEAPIGMVEMEDVPLLSEIQRVCASYGRTIRQVFVRMQPVANSYTPIPLLAFDNPYSTSKPRLVVQSENIKQLNPATYTAALSYNFAKMPTARLSDKTVINPVGVFPMLLLFVVMALAMFLVVPLVLPGNSRFTATGIILMPIVVFITMFGMRIFFTSSALRAHRAASKVWKEAEPAEERTIQDYTNAMFEHHAFHHRIADTELVMHQLKLDQGFHKFVEENAVASVPEDIWTIALQHLKHWQAEAQ